MHLDALNAVITGAGGTAITQMNQAVYDALVKPSIDSAKTETDAVNLALALEEAAAQTYVFAGGALSTPGLRSTIMTIGGVAWLLPRRQPARRHRRSSHHGVRSTARCDKGPCHSIAPPARLDDELRLH